MSVLDLKSGAVLHDGFPVIPLAYPDIPFDGQIVVFSEHHPRLALIIHQSAENSKSALSWKDRADNFESENSALHLSIKNQELRISELCGRVNSLNDVNVLALKQVKNLKNQVFFSSIALIFALMPQILKLFS